MKIIISPTKKMNENVEDTHMLSTPVFLHKTSRLLEKLKAMDFVALKKLYKANDDITALNMERFQTMNLHEHLSPALLSYEGIAFQYMAPQIFEEDYYQYVNEHLRILSGFYGILKPFDGVVCYRLEMQAKLQVDKTKNLYDFWKDDLYHELTKHDHVILNLASKEYSQTISKYLQPSDRWIDVVFGEMIDGKVKEKGVYVKMARGEMVRYMAKNHIEDICEIQKFDRLGFVFEKSLSHESCYVFLRKGQ